MQTATTAKSNNLGGQSARLITWALALAQLVSWGSVYYSFSLFVVPMEQTMGWSRTATNAALSVGLLVSGFAAYPIGRWIDHGLGRRVMAVGSVIAAAMLLLWADAQSLAVLFVAWMRTPKHEATPVETLTLEHVLPQTWDTLDGHYPLTAFTPEAKMLRETYLHTFGNLTLLTGPLNGSASNHEFQIKRVRICESLYVLNHYFQTFEGTTWSDADIRVRGERLFETALKVWPMAKLAICDEAEKAA